MSPPYIADADVSPANPPSPSSTARVSSLFSQVQAHRIHQPLPFPSVLKNRFQILDGPPSSAVANPGN